MLTSVLSLITVSAEEPEPYKTEYVKVNSVDEIVPGARYIIVGTYTDDEGNVTYHAMGKDNRPNDGFRSSYAQDQFGAHNFDISEDINMSIEPQIIDSRQMFGKDYYGFNCNIRF